MTAWVEPKRPSKDTPEHQRYFFDGHDRWLFWRSDGQFELFGRNGNGVPILRGLYRSSTNDEDPLDLEEGLVFIIPRSNWAFLLTRVRE